MRIFFLYMQKYKVEVVFIIKDNLIFQLSVFKITSSKLKMVYEGKYFLKILNKIMQS